MTEEYCQPEAGQIDEHRIEIENRIKNLCWTVSGDYTLAVRPDVEAFTKSKYIALYDAIKQGAFEKYFDSQKLAFYITKKCSCQAQEKPLLELARLCIDAAVYPLIAKERLGIDEIRRQAFEGILKHQKTALHQTFFGQAGDVMIKRFLGREDDTKITAATRQAVRTIDTLEGVGDTEGIIAVIDKIYNTVFDQTFEARHGNLAQVLNLNPLEIAQDAWQDCMTDEQMQEVIRKYLSNLDDDTMRLEVEDSSNTLNVFSLDFKTAEKTRMKTPDKEAMQKVSEYIRLNYGRSYLAPLEQERRNHKLCKEIHANAALHFTDGILHNPVLKNNQYRFSQLQFEKNRAYYYSNHRVVKQNIALLSGTLKKTLVLRREEDICRSVTGQLVPARLWKLSRTDDPKLFDKKLTSDNSEFVVDILLDASGSQAKRQSQVAAQGYIISEALSQAGIAHRVSGYCTFWDYTILQRFRDYDDGKEQNHRIFEFRASANNRDGLAIKAACHSLLERAEENKILIVLSDGKPNDLGARRPGTRKTSPYTGEAAVRDTAFEVRKARGMGISVLGIFAGNYQDLFAEKRIYGKDFAYIRNISNFSRIVGTYLRGQLDKD